MKNLILALLVIAAVVFSCKKKDKKTEDTTNSTTTTTTGAAPVIDINSDPTTEFKIDGTDYKYVQNSNTIENGTGASKNSGSVTVASYSSDFNDYNTKVYLQIEKGSMTFSGNLAANADYKAFFAPASYTYSPNALNGIAIEWWDSNNVMWSTDKGTMDQSGSAFTIISNQELNSSYYYVKVYATFNCKLYDGNGNSKTLTNGKFVGFFGNI